MPLHGHFGTERGQEPTWPKTSCGLDSLLFARMNPFDLQQHITNSIILDSQLTNYGKTEQELKPQYMENNVWDVDLDTPVYRLFSEERFFDMLQAQQLTLVRTNLWQDPFENFLLRATWETRNGNPIEVHDLRDRYYGQCWTLRKECDGLWRNYRGVRKDASAAEPYAYKVATTVRKLMDQFYDLTTPYHALSYYIGKVTYCSDAQIKGYFAQPEPVNTPEQMSNVRYPRTMLIKREAFSYEQEVRMIFSDNPDDSRTPAPASPLHQVPIDVNSLFDFIELDPTMPAADRNSVEARIKAGGYTGPITQSDLYTDPNFVVRLAI